MIPLHDAPAAGGRRAAVREREDTVTAALRSLGTALDGEPDPAFRRVTRARLVAMAAVRTPEPAPAPRTLLSRLAALRPEPTRSPARRRLTAGLAGAALAVTAVAALVAVAAGAGPGDPLYGLKRGTEQTQLALSGDDRGLALLGFAHTRLTELAGLTGSGDTEVAAATLRTMDEETTQGTAAVAARAVATQDAATAQELAAWAATQSTELAALRPRLPAGARPATDQSSALLARVTDRGTALTTALQCSAGPTVGGTDPLGPVPLTCGAGPAGTAAQAGGGTSGTVAVPGSAGAATPVPATGAVPESAPGGTTPGTPGTAGAPATQGVPSTGVPSTGLPSTGLPSTGVGTTGTGSGGLLPPLGTTLPTTSPLPGTGTVGVPPLLPGTTPTTTPTTSSGTVDTSGTGSLPGVSVCVPPVTIGTC